jgi:DNA-directed RNA polymerase specialized sigma24 family protein
MAIQHIGRRLPMRGLKRVSSQTQPARWKFAYHCGARPWIAARPIRSRERRIVVGREPGLRSHTRPDYVDSPLVALGPSPEAEVEAQQSLSAVMRLLEGVSPRTCEIYLAHRAGYTYDEISSRLNVSHITIRRHIARALAAIMGYRAIQGQMAAERRCDLYRRRR